MRVAVAMVLMENFARQVFLPMGVHVDFGGCNSASRYTQNLQPRTDIQRCYRVFQQFWRHSGIHQGA
jgi:hypothetical protein